MLDLECYADDYPLSKKYTHFEYSSVDLKYLKSQVGGVKELSNIEFFCDFYGRVVVPEGYELFIKNNQLEIAY